MPYRLYDQAQLLSNYLDAYIITKDTDFLDAVNDIATYITSPLMCSPSGGFFSAEDADSLYRPSDKEKREGAFYVWKKSEVTDILGAQDAEIAARYYGIVANGNVNPEHDAHDELFNQNVLAVSSTVENVAKEFGQSEEEIRATLARARKALSEHREATRPRPALDDKIIVAWNGLAISSLARASAAIATTEAKKARSYLDSAIQAASFIKKELYSDTDHTLKRVYREGPGDAPAFADDYAFLIAGLIDLYEATFDDSWLEWADALQSKS